MSKLDELNAITENYYMRWSDVLLDDLLRFEAIQRIQAELDTATEELLQRYRDAASLRVDEIFALREERDDLRELLRLELIGNVNWTAVSLAFAIDNKHNDNETRNRLKRVFGLDSDK